MRQSRSAWHCNPAVPQLACILTVVDQRATWAGVLRLLHCGLAGLGSLTGQSTVHGALNERSLGLLWHGMHSLFMLAFGTDIICNLKICEGESDMLQIMIRFNSALTSR